MGVLSSGGDSVERGDLFNVVFMFAFKVAVGLAVVSCSQEWLQNR